MESEDVCPKCGTGRMFHSFRYKREKYFGVMSSCNSQCEEGEHLHVTQTCYVCDYKVVSPRKTADNQGVPE